jgi:hypothetical protein
MASKKSKNRQRANPQIPPDGTVNLAPGLASYYSSQAEAMLSQFQNINHLLGPTHDQTHPGTFCEVLLRDFLRRFLPTYLSVDKGYVFGRAVLQGKDIHCPEIDILIHDTHTYAPLFRMGDFVIVQPEAVKAIIQVKKTLTNPEVERGLKNVIHAKAFAVNRQRENNYSPERAIFTAVVGFQRGPTEKNGTFYKNALVDWEKKFPSPTAKDGMIETGLWMLPDFIGSIVSCFLFRPGEQSQRVESNKLICPYVAYHSKHNGKNIAIQFLLAATLRAVVWPRKTGVFAFPQNVRHIASFEIPDHKRSRK